MKRMLPWLLLVAFIVSVNGFADSDSAALFKSKCAMCHGPDGTGSAMGQKLGVKSYKSPDIQEAVRCRSEERHHQRQRQDAGLQDPYT